MRGRGASTRNSRRCCPRPRRSHLSYDADDLIELAQEGGRQGLLLGGRGRLPLLLNGLLHCSPAQRCKRLF